MGQCRYVNGDQYEGPWVNGRREGSNGKQVYANGDSYVGDWRADWREGQGTMHFANGDVYEVLMGDCYFVVCLGVRIWLFMPERRLEKQSLLLCQSRPDTRVMLDCVSRASGATTCGTASGGRPMSAVTNTKVAGAKTVSMARAVAFTPTEMNTRANGPVNNTAVPPLFAPLVSVVVV